MVRYDWYIRRSVLRKKTSKNIYYARQETSKKKKKKENVKTKGEKRRN